VHSDIVVVGGGFAGLCASWLLSSSDCEVTVVERSPSCRPCFKAEKLEPYQSRLMREFGLLDERRPAGPSIDQIGMRRGGRLSVQPVGEQYGIRYHDTVNQLRHVVATRVPILTATVADVRTGQDVQVVRMRDGSTIRSRLVIVAAGGSALMERLGMRRRVVPRLRTLSLGFDLERADGTDFRFRGFNYVPGRPERDRVNFLTLFRIGPVMRANLFTMWSPTEARVREFLDEPDRALRRLCPGLERDTGEVSVASRVQAVPTSYHRLDGVRRPGVVVVGEEFQSVSPATGTGLDKVLTDVAVLCRDHVPEWLSTPGMGMDKVARFYRDATKRRVDERSRAEWAHSHNLTSRPGSARLRRYAWRARQLLRGRVS
jgi:2-polyprenyl-6-methoxyphenol hydroxylase-like FAD-dependent oxidoreductase